MKKLYLLLIGFSLCLTTAYADNTLSLQNLSIDQGTTEVALPISLTNENSITGFQCDLYLPSGVMVATDEYGDYMISVARTTASRHTISTSLQADGALRILCTSMTNATFSGNSGTVLNVTLAVPESMAAGTHDMSLKNIVLSDPDANRHTSSDMTATLVVEGGGIEESVNVLSLQDLSIEQGTTEAVLPISLTNESSITGFQCDLYLPSGVTVATDEYGDYMIAVARTTASRHTISTSLQADGALRILCTSMTNATFSGNSGTVLNVTLAVLESMAAGTHDMSLKNIVLSDPDANRHTSPDMTSSLIVAEVEKITIRANNITMVYGDAMPKFTYTSEGAELVGAPVLSCSATSTSPVGTYPITVAKGSVENKNVSLVNGTLTIVKAPLTISAGSYTKKQGEVNPKFTATYSGFKNGETANVLTKQPTFTTDVTTSTAPGQYAVKVSGAEAQNYEISYVDGSIIVTGNIEGDYIFFEDAEVERICLANWDTNGDGLFSKDEAAAVTDLGTVFKNNSKIKTFDELQYFTGLTKIGSNTFYYCTSLEFVSFPNTIKTIEASVFYGCSNLKSLVIPPSVTSFSSGLNYKYCRKLASIVVEEGNQVYDSRDNCNAVIQKSSNTLMLGCMNTIIPNTVKEIGAYAFDNCYGLLKIEVPESVTKINSYGFSTCIAATEVSLPNSLTYIAGSAFYNCESITSLKIPGSVTYIGGTSFAECFALKEIELPKSVTTIEWNAFGRDTSLVKMTVAWETPLSITSNVFLNTDISKTTLYVPKGTKALYESAEVWKDFGTIVEVPAITANDIIIEYGDNIPQLTFRSDVEVIGTPALSCSATSTSPVGTYPITVAKGSVEDKNVSLVNGTLTIVKAPLAISAGSYTKKLGEENPEFTATYSGFKNGETSAVLTKQPTFTTDVTVSTAPGQYAVKVSGAEAQNYELSYVDGTITVTDADKVTITANDITMVYGDAVPELTYASSDELIGVPQLSCSATSKSPVGTYPITISKGSVENYNVEYVSGTLTIVKAPLTISAGSYTKKQGEKNPNFTATCSGFKNGETASVLTKQPTFTTDVTTSTAPGQYAVKVSGAEAQNYEISYVDGLIIVINSFCSMEIQAGEYGRCIVNNQVVEPNVTYSSGDVLAYDSILTIYFVPFEGYTTICMKRNGTLVVVRNNMYEEKITEDVVFSDIRFEALADTFYISDYEDLIAPIITSNGAMVAIALNIPGITIYYTTDGSIPTSVSKKYTGPFEATDGMVVSAIAILESKVAQKTISVSGIEGASSRVKSYRFFNESGMELKVPSQGVNIVLTEYDDGSRKVTKMYRK